MASPGMDQQRLAELQNVIRADIKAGLYHGAVIKVARRVWSRWRRPSAPPMRRRPNRWR